MALEGSVEGLEKLESNGVIAYIDSGLREFVNGHGKINIDYVQRSPGHGGYMVTIGDASGCGSGGSFSC